MDGNRHWIVHGHPLGLNSCKYARRAPEPTPEVGEELQLTPGSVGHPEICRRQCIYFQAGHCSNGDACTYCHLPHPQKSPKLDKRQRAILQALTHKELLALILHLCRSKAEEIGMWVEAKEVIAILEAEAGNTPVPEMAEREKRALRKSLLRMKLVIASICSKFQLLFFFLVLVLVVTVATWGSRFLVFVICN